MTPSRDFFIGDQHRFFIETESVLYRDTSLLQIEIFFIFIILIFFVNLQNIVKYSKNPEGRTTRILDFVNFFIFLFF